MGRTRALRLLLWIGLPLLVACGGGGGGGEQTLDTWGPDSGREVEQPAEVLAPDSGTHGGVDLLQDTGQDIVADPCGPAARLACGDEVEGSTVGAGANLSTYPCVGWDASGPELLYAFTAATDDTIRVTLDGLAEGLDLEVYLLAGDCTPGDCEAYGSGGAEHEVTAGTTYYIVVDGGAGQQGAFRLRLDCASVCLEPRCGERECGEAPGCFGESCGDCPQGTVCGEFGFCRRDPCDGVPSTGCCEEDTLRSCMFGVPVQASCGGAGCGWNPDMGSYGCGFSGADPAGSAPRDCWRCDIESFCQEAGWACGEGCGGQSCGDCPEGEMCQQHQCVAAVAACTASATLSCGVEPQVVVGSTLGGTNTVTDYPACGGFGEDGPEAVYALRPSCAGPVRIALTSDEGASLGFYVLADTCAPETCLAWGVDELVLNLEAERDYFVVVDGYAGDESDFELRLSCDCACEAQCGERVCGPDPLCGESCGTCGEGMACDEVGQCYADPCDGVTDVGCCEGAVAYFCQNGELGRMDCRGEQHCGWNGFWEVYECGTDGGAEPSGTWPKDCGFCQESASCATLGRTCGPHPECPDHDCGSCPTGQNCVEGGCQEPSGCGGTPIPIDCGARVEGDLADGENYLSGYPDCVNWDESGPEIVYVWTAPRDDRVTLTLEENDPGGDADIFVLEGDCAYDRCIAYDGWETSFAATAGETYYFVVDGYQGSTAEYALTMLCDSECPVALNCADRICGPSGCYGADPGSGQWGPIWCGACEAGQDCVDGQCVAGDAKTCADPGLLACGQSAFGDTTGAANNMQNYDCMMGFFRASGPEHVWRLDLTAPVGQVVTRVSVELEGIDVELAAHLNEGTCNEAGAVVCSGPGDGSNGMSVDPGVNYWFIVDGYGSTAGPYLITLTCTYEAL